MSLLSVTFPGQPWTQEEATWPTYTIHSLPPFLTIKDPKFWDETEVLRNNIALYSKSCHYFWNVVGSKQLSCDFRTEHTLSTHQQSLAPTLVRSHGSCPCVISSRECGQDVVTGFWRTEYSKLNRMSVPGLGYKTLNSALLTLSGSSCSDKPSCPVVRFP